mmetsp:Transcript_18979/g.54687  ORF Transcript_18979/g.54687 Transcript_18979/m.54687 type:complete len:109 (+) Transcript_18979:20-346(+)
MIAADGPKYVEKSCRMRFGAAASGRQSPLISDEWPENPSPTSALQIDRNSYIHKTTKNCGNNELLGWAKSISAIRHFSRDASKQEHRHDRSQRRQGPLPVDSSSPRNC